jgi:hypothetical protein
MNLRQRCGAAAWAGQLPAKELQRNGWTAAEPAQRPKGELQKLELTRRLRQDTKMTLNWIAKRLNKGAAGALANRLGKAKKKRQYAMMWVTRL